MGSRLAVAVGSCVALVACSGTSSEREASPTSRIDAATTIEVEPAAPPTSAATTTRVPDSSAVPSSTTPDAPLVSVIAPQDDCRFPSETAATDGELSFVAGGHVFIAEPGNGVARCVTGLLGDPPDSMLWSPDGDQLLIGGDVFTSRGPVTDGFEGVEFAEVAARWSHPTGVRTIGIVDGRLVKNEVATGNRDDISFLADHRLVAYHPSGKAIAVVGTGADGTFGIYLASNTGKDHRLIVRGESEPDIVDLVFDPSGENLWFVAGHDGEFHLHLLSMAGLVLSELVSQTNPLGPLTVDAAGRGVALRSGDCSSPTTVATTWLVSPIEAPDELDTQWLEPVGFVSTGLVVAARSEGCTGPSDLYLLGDRALTEGRWDGQLLVRNVDAAAVRVLWPTGVDLRDDIEAQAPA